MFRIARIAALAVLAFVAGILPAAAQDYPNKAVKLIVSYPPGGTTDVLARIIAQWLTEKMGQQFVVIRNMPTPGSEAFRAWEARQEKKNIRKGIIAEAAPIEEVKPAQRQQPMGKNRAKRGKGKK